MNKNSTPRLLRTLVASVIAATSLTALTAAVAPAANAATPSITSPASGPYRTGQPLTIAGYDGSYSFLQLHEGAGCTGRTWGYYLVAGGEVSNGTFTVTVPPFLTDGPVNGTQTSVWHRETHLAFAPHESAPYLRIKLGSASACVGPLGAALFAAPMVTIDKASAAVGDTLTATASSSPSPGGSVRYTWYADGREVFDSFSRSTYVVTPQDAGKSITAQARFGRAGYQVATAVSGPISVAAVPKIPVMITADDKTKVFGDEDPELTYTTTGLQGDDSLALEPTCTRTAGEDVGNRMITCSGAEADARYAITYETGSLTVEPRQVTVTPTGQSITYGDALPASYPYTVTQGSLVGADTLAGSCGVTGTPRAVGQYKITCSLTAGDNYGVTVADAFLTIAKKDGVVTPDPHTITYGDADPEFTYSVSGLVDGDALDAEPTCGVTGAHSKAGEYVITCAGGAAENYSLTHARSTLAVTKKPVTVTPSAVSAPFGGAVPAPAPAYAGFVDGDVPATVFAGTGHAAPTCDANTARGTSAGTYPDRSTCSGGSAANYTFDTTPKGTVTITQAAVKVTTTASTTLVSIVQGFRYTFTTTVTNGAPGAGGAPAAGVRVAIRVPGTSVSCTAVTNAQGVAVCATNPIFLVLGRKAYTATTAASTNYEAGAGNGVIETL